MRNDLLERKSRVVFARAAWKPRLECVAPENRGSVGQAKQFDFFLRGAFTHQTRIDVGSTGARDERECTPRLDPGDAAGQGIRVMTRVFITGRLSGDSGEHRKEVEVADEWREPRFGLDESGAIVAGE